jgi:hypothetical protein
MTCRLKPASIVGIGEARQHSLSKRLQIGCNSIRCKPGSSYICQPSMLLASKYIIEQCSGIQLVYNLQCSSLFQSAIKLNRKIKETSTGESWVNEHTRPDVMTLFSSHSWEEHAQVVLGAETLCLMRGAAKHNHVKRHDTTESNFK